MNLNKYNSPDTLLVISPYPSRGTIHTGGGIASYAKNTLLAIKKSSPDQKVVVLTNVVDKKETYLEDGILVVRRWERTSYSFYPQVLAHLAHFSKIKRVLFEFEFAAYGDLFTTGAIPFLLSLLKLSGKTVTTVLHQVVQNLNELSSHTGLGQKEIQKKIFDQGLRFFYQVITVLSDTIITLEPALADRLSQITGRKNIIAIPHGLFLQKSLARSTAVRNLSLSPKNLYVLAFGYLSQYKGSDLIVKAFEKPIKVNGQTVKLILAGGESPTQGQKAHYRGYYKRLYEAIDSNPNIIHTGFVPDSRISSFFSACDLTVFPYRAFMSASGPVSLALAYQKPILTSNKLASYGQFHFANNRNSIRIAISKLLSNKNALKNCLKQSEDMAFARNFANQGEKYLQAFNPVDNFDEGGRPVLNYSK